MKYLFLIFSSITIYSQNIISGRVLSDNGFVVHNVEIVNMRNGSKALSNDEGYFKIEARTNDELRFLKENFERGSKVIQNYDFLKPISINLLPLLKLIRFRCLIRKFFAH